MRIDRMREYVRLCETLNFSKASKELFLSQSTLSKHINQIEDELGSELILRSTHEATLTREGAEARDRFIQIIDSYDALIGALNEMREGIVGNLRIGFIYYGGMDYAREGIKRFRKECPNVRLDLISQQPHDAVAGLQSGELDACVISQSPILDSEGFSSKVLCEAEVRAFVSPHGRFSDLRVVNAGDFESAPVVMLDADEDYNESVRIMLHDIGVKSFSEVRCPQVDLYPMTVSEEDAIFIASAVVPTPSDGSVIRLPFDNRISAKVCLYYRNDSTNGALHAFVRSFG